MPIFLNYIIHNQLIVRWKVKSAIKSQFSIRIRDNRWILVLLENLQVLLERDNHGWLYSLSRYFRLNKLSYVVKNIVVQIKNPQKKSFMPKLDWRTYGNLKAGIIQPSSTIILDLLETKKKLLPWAWGEIRQG